MNQSGESRFGPENMNSYSASKLKKKIAFSMNGKFLILKRRKKKESFNKNILCNYPAHALLMYFNAFFLDSNINSTFRRYSSI